MKTLADLGDIAMLTRQVKFLFVCIKTLIREHIYIHIFMYIHIYAHGYTYRYT